MGVWLSCRNSSVSDSTQVKLQQTSLASASNCVHVATVEQHTGPLVQSQRTLAHSYNKMANTISNIKMTSTIKELVSKKRKRYKQDGFDLDLTYIRDNLIAMGFPSDRVEGLYRNHIDDVVKFLEKKHKDHYKIYNLCSERSYDIGKFHSRVAKYAFDDHNPPTIELIKPFCEDVDEWLGADSQNVAVVHCKAGKGRTGVMICCYMLHSKVFSSAELALAHYGQKRTHDEKGVTIPSQLRYVGYYASLVHNSLNYMPVTLVLKEIHLEPVMLATGAQFVPQIVLIQNRTKLYTSPPCEAQKSYNFIPLKINSTINLVGDVKVEVYNKPNKVMRKERLCHFWFNTFFVAAKDTVEQETHQNGCDLKDDSSTIPPHPDRMDRAMSCPERTLSNTNSQQQKRTSSLMSLDDHRTVILTLHKWELDNAHKDRHNKTLSSEFKIRLHFVVKPDGDVSKEAVSTNTWRPQTNSASSSPSESEADSSEADNEDDEGGWESARPPSPAGKMKVDSAERRVGRYRLLSDSDMKHSNQVYQM